jgi:hypothetical protein
VAGTGGGPAGVEEDVEEHQNTNIACVAGTGQKMDRAQDDTSTNRGTRQSERATRAMACATRRPKCSCQLGQCEESSGPAAQHSPSKHQLQRPLRALRLRGGGAVHGLRGGQWVGAPRAPPPPHEHEGVSCSLQSPLCACARPTRYAAV